ncbi:hypothetical protein SKAU_G00367450 [Synaphobranchus kaupii]|uniref:Uncharacterized protein n=1 Tax=Synaphobranchus kaupii TaxID=118154 RepID=A0A9Q1EFD5_SYNKA|nr:hypothetical protein SKAU_G00367450 [Synaphobranchus kaupii]
MSKLLCLSLLFLVLIWCGCPVESRRRKGMPQPLKNDCKCKVTPNMKVSCPKEAMPRSSQQKLDILKCLCKKHRYEQRMDVNFRRICKKIYGDFSIPLPLT